jgi:N-acetylmuramoyl-L-alanine amidase
LRSEHSTACARIVRRAVFSAAAIVVSSLLLFSAPAEQKRVSIYSLVANYSLPVLERNGQDYAGLLEALEPLGKVSATTQGSTWTLRYNDLVCEFPAGSRFAQIRRERFDLHGSFLLEHGRGLVPVSSLGSVLSRILNGPVTFHEASRRIFIGSVAVHFTAQIAKRNPPTLVMHFTAPVNPMIATEPGKLHMIFSHEPLVAPGSPTLTFSDKVIPSASYQEGNGAAEITVNSRTPLFASFSNGNRTITIAPTPSAPPTQTAQSQTAPAAAGAVAGASGPPRATPSAAPTATFAVVDASHGGSERGEAITPQLAEKDVTLAFARTLQQQLQTRGLTTLLLRDGDTTLTLDQRAAMTNVAKAEIYISLHASSEGHGVRLYTAMLPAGGEDSGPFLDWNTAQSAFLPLSKAAAAGLAAPLQQQRVPVRVLMAPLRPLNNVTTAAVAIEVAPPQSGVADLDSPAYQQLVTSAIATGVLAVRDKLEAGR